MSEDNKKVNETIDEAINESPEEVSSGFDDAQKALGQGINNDEDYSNLINQFGNMFSLGNNNDEGDEGDEGDAGFDMSQLAELFGQGGDGSFDMQSFMQQMMQDMMSKEYLYEPMRDLATRFPAYLEEHSSKHTAEELETYAKQLACYKAITAAFEQVPEDTATVHEKMGELQAYGPPPRDLLPEEDREALDNMAGQGMSGDEAEALTQMGSGCAQQ